MRTASFQNLPRDNPWRNVYLWEKVGFSESERAKTSDLIEKLPEEVRQEFDTKYRAWKATWNDPKVCIHSNPRSYAVSKEYEEFLDYCKKQGKAIWPLLLQKFEQGDFLVINALEDLTFAEYRYILDEITQESSQERYTEEGVYIAPSPRANWMKYIKKLLAVIGNFIIVS
ncbi:MAG: hypothetical protein IMF11_01555 [Proteobacteria bacterium]|nr:hypothetical protein [Pseudomonadota bacterium]